MNVRIFRRPIRSFAVLASGLVLAVGTAAPRDALAATQVAAGARAAAAGGTWGSAQEVAAALNTGGFAEVNSVSCASAGNCSAGGFYTSSSGPTPAFVVSEANGAWGAAHPVAAALNRGGIAAVSSVSCASAGNCSAGGFYTDKSGFRRAFVVSEANGAWGTAQHVAAALNTGGDAEVNSVSCATAGNCTAGGYYDTLNPSSQPAFVVTETNGTWGTARKVAAGRVAVINSVSCAAPGNCTAGGTSGLQAFAVNEKNGTWGTAQKVAAALNTGGFAAVNSVSCATAGNCSAGGYYTDSSGNAQAFGVSSRNGAWGTADEIPGSGTFNKGGYVKIDSVSCAVAGNCSAGGYYLASSGRSQAFVVTETNGTWGSLQKVAAALNTGHFAAVNSVSCAAAGNCSAGGSYASSSGLSPAFAVNQTNGTWGPVQQVATALNTSGAAINSVSCPSAGHCSAGGYINDGGQAIVARET
jgi:hypothetical protein